MHTATQSLKIFRRSKNVDGGIGKQAVELTFASLQKYFSLPIAKAALQLGVCTTSLKWWANLPVKIVSHTEVLYLMQCMPKIRDKSMAVS